MPLFIFISGYFQKTVTNFSFCKKKLEKSINHIAIPMINWIILAYVIKLLLNLENYNGISYFVNQSHGIVSLFWYLGCLLMCIFLYTAISLCYNYNKYLGISLFITSIVSQILINISIFHFSFLWTFFVLGILYNKYGLPNIVSCPKWIKYYLLFFLLYLVFLYKTSWTFYNTDNCIFTLDSGWGSELIFILYRYFIYIMSTLCSFYLLKKLYSVLSNTWLSKVIIALGRETLFLYVAHVTILYFFSRPIIYMITGVDVILPDFPIIRYYLLCPLCTIVLSIILFYLSIYIKKYTPFISKYLLGD